MSVFFWRETGKALFDSNKSRKKKENARSKTKGREEEAFGIGLCCCVPCLIALKKKKEEGARKNKTKEAVPLLLRSLRIFLGNKKRKDNGEQSSKMKEKKEEKGRNENPETLLGTKERVVVPERLDNALNGLGA